MSYNKLFNKSPFNYFGSVISGIIWHQSKDSLYIERREFYFLNLYIRERLIDWCQIMPPISDPI